jgi:predicted dehydrogenase
MLNFALVGCGNMGNWHAQQLQKISEVNVVALCDPINAQTAQYKEKYFPQAKEYDDYQQLLERPPAKLDAVVLVTPHMLHYPQAKAALERGIHVLVEKPMVTSSEHAYDLWHTVKQTGKLLGITFQSPYTPEFNWIAQQRDAGAIGRIQLISGHVSQGWLKGTAGKWRQDPHVSGGGQMYDTGAHLLNAFMWLTNSPVTDVACFYDTCGAPVDINGVASMRFANGVMGSVAIGGNCPSWSTEIQIQTDTCRIVTDQYGGKLEVTGNNNRRLFPHITLDEHPAAGTPHLNFVRAINGQEPLRAPVRYGVLLSALMDAMYESAQHGRIVIVKPVPDSI